MWIGCGRGRGPDLAPPAVEVHQAREVAAHQVARRGRGRVPELGVGEPGRDLGEAEREHAAEPAARVGFGHLDQRRARGREQRARLAAPSPRLRSPWHASCTVTVVSRRAPMSSTPSTSTRYCVSSNVRAASASASSRAIGEQVGIVVAHHRRARARRRDDRVDTPSSEPKTSRW